MVSFNFSSNCNTTSVLQASKKTRTKAKPAAVNQKPVCVIDVMSSPYRIIEESPREVVDVLSEDEDKNKKSGGGPNNNNHLRGQQKTTKTRTTPPSQLESAQRKTPSPKESPEKQALPSQQQQQSQQTQQQQMPQIETVGGDLIIHTGHKGPCTPPPFDEAMIDLTRGPQTPSDPPDDSYDPCNPTESPDISWENQGQGQSDGELNQSTDSSMNNDFPSSMNGNGGKEDQVSFFVTRLVKTGIVFVRRQQD